MKMPGQREESLIQEALARLLPGAAVKAVIREAKKEITTEELHALSPELQKKWQRLSALQRKLEWSEARRCEKILRDALGSAAKTSLSHTRKDDTPIVFAVGAVHDGPIGIDVELSTRAVSAAVAGRFTLPGEEKLPLEPLQLWVIKEAVMKAYADNHGTVPGQYRVVAYDEASGTGTAEIHGSTLRFARVEIDGWVVAVSAS